jgi:hypothetical protein
VNGPEHYAEAEKLLRRPLNGMVEIPPDTEAVILALAHAVLALTAATVDSSEEINSMASVYGKWDSVGAAGFDG